MSALIENERRARRVQVQCGVRIALRSGAFFTSCTVDIGPGGCGVVAAPARLEPGDRVFLEIDLAGAGHLLAGRVAWSSSTPPWRSGLAFDGGSLGAAAALFARIASAGPELLQQGLPIEPNPEEARAAPGQAAAGPHQAPEMKARD